MTLRVEILVLFLALCGVSAEQGLLALPTFNLVSAVQQISLLRQSPLRTHHSSGRNLLSNNFSRSLQSTEETCAWDADNEECSPSIFSMMNLLEESDTEFAELLVKHFECLEKTTKGNCDAKSACIWDDVVDECAYLDLRRDHENSPCAKAAPLFFDVLEASTMCPKQESNSSCERKRQCSWSSEDASCDVDSFQIYFGIADFQEKSAQVMNSKAAAVRREYSALRSSSGFTWQSVLDYKPRRIVCPSNVERLVCRHLDALIPHILGPEFYCSGKYRLAVIDCIADTRCRWNAFSAECESDSSRAISTATLSASKVLTDSMPDGTDKRVVEATFSCAGISERGRCYGNCIWDQRNGVCALRIDRMTTLVTSSSKNSTDALCRYLEVDGFSECHDQHNKAECQRRESCRWHAHGECVVKERLYLSAAADQDASLENRYTQIKRQCLENTPPGECEVDTDASPRITFSTWTFLLVSLVVQYMIVLH